ncbi:MAG: hypothetical protein AAFV29_19970, partial [Myxococcota bacterium]
LGIHPQTLKQLRLEGKIDFVRIGRRNISYLGVHIGDHIIGSIQWQSQTPESSGSATTPSRGDQGAKDGGEPGMTQSESIRAASRLARTTLKKPKKD